VCECVSFAFFIHIEQDYHTESEKRREEKRREEKSERERGGRERDDVAA
jgi:hypothetical protein